jgi:hypothetical protein
MIALTCKATTGVQTQHYNNIEFRKIQQPQIAAEMMQHLEENRACRIREELLVYILNHHWTSKTI